MAELTLNQIKNGQNKIDIILLITKKDPIRQIRVKATGEIKDVADCYVQDKEGNKGYLSLWGEQIAKFSEGDMVQLTNGYAHLYEGNVNLSSGKTGELAKVENV